MRMTKFLEKINLFFLHSEIEGCTPKIFLWQALSYLPTQTLYFTWLQGCFYLFYWVITLFYFTAPTSISILQHQRVQHISQRKPTSVSLRHTQSVVKGAPFAINVRTSSSSPLRAASSNLFPRSTKDIFIHGNKYLLKAALKGGSKKWKTNEETEDSEAQTSKPSTTKAWLASQQTHRTRPNPIQNRQKYLSVFQFHTSNIKGRQHSLRLLADQTLQGPRAPAKSPLPQQHLVQTQRLAHVDPVSRAEPIKATAKQFLLIAQHHFDFPSALISKTLSDPSTQG